MKNDSGLIKCGLWEVHILAETHEKLGKPEFNAMLEFQEMIHAPLRNGACFVGYKGGKYTWCNNQSGNNSIWARLDRALVNMSWIKRFTKTFLEHLSRTCPNLL